MLRWARPLMLIIALLATAASARSDSLGSGDRQAITGLITSQLQAFAADRDAEAYSYAAPVVQLAFPTLDSFMAMVRSGYSPVYRNNGYRFGADATDATGRPTKTVILKGTDGKTYEALYTLQRQPDGTWKIAGCSIRVLPGTEV